MLKITVLGFGEFDKMVQKGQMEQRYQRDNSSKGYHKLIVWQRAKDLVVLAYKITDKFPKSEEFGLKSQMRRAAVSVLSQIAEGYSRRSIRDKKHFIEIGIGSLFELESDIEVSIELGFISVVDYELIEDKRGEVGFLLNRYFNSL